MIRRRAVFYVAGFDPRGPEHYHQLMLQAVKDHDQNHHSALTVGPIQRDDRYSDSWTITGANDQHLRYTVLRWDDLIRQHWHRHDGALIRDAVPLYRAMWNAGFFGRLRRAAPWFCFSSIYPGLVMALSPLGGVTLGGLAAWACAPWLGWWALLIGLVISLTGWWILRRLAPWIKADWVLRALIFCRNRSNTEIPHMAQRLDLMAERIGAAVADPTLDEILVVGHSAGATLVVEAVHRLLTTETNLPPQRLGLITLGHIVHMSSWWPGSQVLRQQLQDVANDPRVDWLDVTAAPDGVCLAGMNPAVSTPGQPDGPRPRCMPARFHRQFSPARYRWLRRDKYRIHFQYIMAPDLAAGFDYVRLLTSDQPLADYTPLTVGPEPARS